MWVCGNESLDPTGGRHLAIQTSPAVGGTAASLFSTLMITLTVTPIAVCSPLLYAVRTLTLMVTTEHSTLTLTITLTLSSSKATGDEEEVEADDISEAQLPLHTKRAKCNIQPEITNLLDNQPAPWLVCWLT